MADVDQLLKSSKHFCILPWIHFHAWPDRRVMPCCVADSTMPVSQIRPDQTVLEMMNSADYRDMRLKMLEDQPIAACKRCYDIEEMGTWTMRQSHNAWAANAAPGKRGSDYADRARATAADGSITDFKMKYMDIRFSNLCNMKCRSCGPSCSSQWSAEYEAQHGTATLRDRFGIDRAVVNSNDDGSFMAQLRPYLDHVEEVYFAGGEIIIQQEHYDCLDHWISQGLTNQVELTYTTNFSNFRYKDRDLLDLWQQFPRLKIYASLDADGDLAAVLRSGTDWPRIERNLRELRGAIPHAQLQITPTISIWNAWQFPDFYDRMIDHGLIDLGSPRFNLATNPWFANLMILPQFAKDQLLARYQQSLKRYLPHRDIANGFKMIMYNISTGEPNAGGLREFREFNARLDSVRSERLLEVVPELEEVYAWADSQP